MPSQLTSAAPSSDIAQASFMRPSTPWSASVGEECAAPLGRSFEPWLTCRILNTPQHLRRYRPSAAVVRFLICRLFAGGSRPCGSISICLGGVSSFTTFATTTRAVMCHVCRFCIVSCMASHPPFPCPGDSLPGMANNTGWRALEESGPADHTAACHLLFRLLGQHI